MNATIAKENNNEMNKLCSFKVTKTRRKETGTLIGTTIVETTSNLRPDFFAPESMSQWIRGVDVFEVRKNIQKCGRTPISVRTAQGEESRQGIGFGEGIHDKVLTIGSVVVNTSRHQVTVKGKDVLLTPAEFKILVCLTERLGRVQSREDLLAAIWNYDYFVEKRTVDIHIRSLRKKLGVASDLIRTIRGFGYKMECLELLEHPEYIEEIAMSPIAAQTAREEEYRQGIRFGADDHDKIFTAGTLVVNTSCHQVTVRGKDIHLTTTEFKLLVCLAERLGSVQSREALLACVFDYNYCAETRTLDTHITRLRKKLGEACDLIKTIRGYGYKMDYQGLLQLTECADKIAMNQISIQTANTKVSRQGIGYGDYDKIFSIGPVVINTSRHQVTVRSKDVHLTTTEFKLLVYLAERLGRVQSMEEILATLWTGKDFVEPRTVSSHITRLRRKLGVARELIITIQGFGYKMEQLELSEEPKYSEETARTPIVVQTEKKEESRQRIGFGIGGHDKIFSLGPVVVNSSRHLVTVAGRDVLLTAAEFKLLVCLAERMGRVQSREALLSHVLDYTCCDETRTVDTHIARLRRKLGDDCDMIKTVRGFGYKMDQLEARNFR